MLARLIKTENRATGKEVNFIDSHELVFLPEHGRKEGDVFILNRMCGSGKIDTQEVIENISNIDEELIILTTVHKYVFTEKF